MRRTFLNGIVGGSVVFAILTGCDSEQKIERTHEDHELFGPRTTKPDTMNNNSAATDSVRFPPPDTGFRPR